MKQLIALLVLFFAQPLSARFITAPEQALLASSLLTQSMAYSALADTNANNQDLWWTYTGVAFGYYDSSHAVVYSCMTEFHVMIYAWSRDYSIAQAAIAPSQSLRVYWLGMSIGYERSRAFAAAF